MTKVICPFCGLPAVRVTLIDGYKFYCSRCGWNHQIVRAELSSTIKFGLVFGAAGVLLATAASIKYPTERQVMLEIALTLSLLPLAYSLFAFFQVRKLRKLAFQPITHNAETVATSQSVPSPGDASATITFMEKKFPELAALPRPRKLKMTWRGRGYWSFTLIVVGLYTAYGLPNTWSEFNNPNSARDKHWSLLLLPAMIYGYSFAFFRNRLRERQVLANGELTSGYVTAQNNGQYGQTINYCFILASGEIIASHCNDPSKSVYEGMTLPVFYDTDNPKRSIPLACSLTKVVMPPKV